jgi:membrane fusion protein (multidrug efflux system)
MKIVWRFNLWTALASAGVLVAISGCGRTTSEPGAQQGSTVSRVVPVTIKPLERRTVERTVDVIGSLRGWEQVTVGSKRAGRVVKVHHDIGDRVQPGDPLVVLDSVDAKLGVEQAESKYLGELVKMGITKRQAEEFVQQYGISEELLNGRVASEAVTKVPPVVQKKVALDKAQQNLARQRALTKRGAGTAQELDDAENELRKVVSDYDGAVQSARTVIADAMSAKVALSQAQQTLKDVTICAPQPKRLPPSSTPNSRLTFGLSKRSVTEGQMIKEGEAVADLVIEDPIRLWSQVSEQYAEDVHVGQQVRISTRAHPGMTFNGKIVRINPSVETSSRTFQVETLVPNERGLLRPGGFARASIVTDSAAKAAVVPSESIVRFAGVTKLFIVENGKARSINDIKTGKEGRGWTEVISEQLPETASVVTTGQTQLADQTLVVVRTPEPTEPPRSTELDQSRQTAAASLPAAVK